MEIPGTPGNDSLVGTAEGDSLVGGAGNDTLAGRRGFDTLVGGPGDDVYLIDDFDDYWVEEADGGFDTLRIAVSGVKLDPDINRHVERVEYVNDALPLANWVDALVFGISFDLMGVPVTVRYAFLDVSPEPGFNPFDEGDQATTRSVLNLWAAPTRMSWQQVAPDEADVVFGFADLGAGTAGQADYSGSATVVLIDNDARGGRMAGDDFWFDVLLHEVGHALWLKHPGDYNGGDGHGTPPYLFAVDDHDGHSVMSYHAAPAGLAQPRQLRALDVAAAQYLYGVNPALNAGDTVHRVDALRWPNNLVADGGGSDSLDASAVVPLRQGAVKLDLRPGAVSTFAEFAFRLQDAGTFSIGYHTVIEHAIGSTGPDSVFGNAADNRLDGGAGNDTLDGAWGRDTLIGGEGDDTLVMRRPLDRAPAAGPTLMEGGAGRDVLQLQFWGDEDDVEVALELRALYASPASGGRFERLGIEVSGIESIVLVGGSGQTLWGAAPVPRPLQVAVDEDARIEFELPEAVDIDGSALSYIPLLSPQGLVTALPGGDGRRVQFQPQADFFGEAVVQYVVRDDSGYTSRGQVLVTVRPMDDAPVLRLAVPDRSATVGQPFNATVAAGTFSDIDSAVIEYSATLEGGGALPAWLRFDPANRTFSGTPAAGDVGLLRVALWANARSAGTAEVFLLGVHAVANALPLGRDASLRLDEDTVLATRVPAATDADGDPLVYELTAAPERGAFEFGADGSFRFAPPAEFSGVLGFDYLVNDGRGGSNAYRLELIVDAVNDPPFGRPVVDGLPVKGASLTVQNAFGDLDGAPQDPQYTWYRGELPIAGVSGWRYTLQPADVGARISVSVSYRDGSGFSNAVVSEPTAVVAAAQLIRGTPGADWLVGSAVDDSIEAGAGDDQIRAYSGGDDTVDGGPGLDTLTADWQAPGEGWRIDLASGLASVNGRALVLRSIEAVVGSDKADRLSGSDATGPAVHEWFAPGWGADTVDGRGGVDLVQIDGMSSSMRITRNGNTLQVRPRDNVAPEAVDALIDVERIRFHDILLAFGTRAEEVAKVAFALWSKGIAAHPYLFGRGISFYDVGYSFDELVTAAVAFFTSDTDQQFAERLANNVASGRSAAELLALMQANGGAGPGQAGRAFATQLVAQHPDNMHNIELAGFIDNGVPCALVADGVLLFAPIGG